MVKALFIFDRQFPRNATLSVVGAFELKDSTIDVGGISQVSVILNSRKTATSLLKGVGAVLTGALKKVGGMVSGGEVVSAVELAHIDVVVEIPDGAGTITRTWSCSWNNKYENIISIFLVNVASSQSVADAVREHLHSGLKSRDKKIVTEVIRDFFEEKLISVSACGTSDDNAPSSELASLRTILNGQINVLEDLLAAPLSDSSSYVARTFLASSMHAMEMIKGTKIAKTIAECAVQDVTCLVMHQALDKCCAYFAHLPNELWDTVCEPHKLAIASALTAFRIPLPLSLQPKKIAEGRLGGFTRKDGWEDGEGRERLEAAMELAFQVDAARQRHRTDSAAPPIPSAWCIIGPYSAAVASMLLGRHGSSAPYRAHISGTWLWEEAGPDRLTAAVQVALEVLAVRAKEVGHSPQDSPWLASFRNLAASHAVDAVRKLGPVRAASVFLDVISLDQICKIIVAGPTIRGEARGEQRELHRMCINLCQQYEQDLVGNGDILQLFANTVLTDENLWMDDGIKNACIQVICGLEVFVASEPSKSTPEPVQIQALSLIKYASHHVFQSVLIQRHTLHKVYGAHRKVCWDRIVGSDFPAVALAVEIAQHWLVGRGGPNAITDAFNYYSSNMDQLRPGQLMVNDADKCTFSSIFCFAVCEAAAGNTEARAMEVFRRHNIWAKKVVDAAKARNPVEELTAALTQMKTSIPVSFLRFLSGLSSSAQADSSGMVCIHSVYRTKLIGEKAIDLDQFLPATSVAHNKAVAMRKLQDWLDRTIRKERETDAADKLKARFAALKERLEAANLSTFPECARATSTDDQKLAEAVNVFMNDAHRCDLFDCKARELFRGLAPAQDALEVPKKALINAQETLEGALAGRIYHEQVRMSARVLTVNSPELQREAGALWALLGKPDRPMPLSADDPIMVYLRLVQLDPSSLVRWAGELRLFAMSMLSVESLPAIDEFLAMYARQDSRTLKLFSEPVDYMAGNLPGDVPNSVYHMLCVFQRDLVDGAPQQSWQLIDELIHTGPLLETLRSRVRSRQDLKCKMDALRMMCVSNRHMSRPVDALDGLADRLYDLLHCNRNEGDVLQHIGHLLKSGALSKAAAESISISELSHLFSYVDSGDDTAKRNARLLRTANIVIDLELLRGMARNSFATGSSLDTVSIKIAQQGSNVLAFRLAGGRMESEVAGAEIEALFIETSVQLSVLPKSSQADEARDGNEALKEVVEISRIRTCKIIELAEKLYKFARLGDKLDRVESSRHLQFGSQTPEKTRSVWDESNQVHGPVFDIEEYMRKFSHIHSLSLQYKNVRDNFPWISFCPPLHVMQRIETPWIKELARISSELSVCEGEHALSAVVLDDVKGIVEWLNRRVSSLNRPPNPGVPINQDREHYPSFRSTIIACSSMNGQEDRSMIRSLALLEAIGGLPYMATAIFPCDSSTGVFAVKELMWRLGRASDLLDAHDSKCSKQQVEQVLMCKGMVIIRPDMLKGTLQDILLSGLARFCKAAANSSFRCPKIALVLPMVGNNRFEELLRTVLDVQILGDCELEKLDANAKTVSIKKDTVTVIMTQLKHSAMGMRPLPSLVPEGTFRIRVGSDTTVADLTVALKSEHARERPISLDFGGEAEEISCRSLAGALVSLIMCSVVGQAQFDAEVVQNQIFIELAASSRDDAIHQLPILSVLTKDRFKTSRLEKSEDFEDVVLPSFKTLIDKAQQGRRIEDSEVERALLEVFESKDVSNRPLRPGTPTPFVHTPISLKTMAIVAHRTRCRLKAYVDLAGLEGSFPVLLSGDTGTGKTYLLFKFLELLRSSGAVSYLDEKVNIYTISANFERLQVEKLGKKIRERIRSTQAQSSGGTAKASLFILDEMTGSPAQEALGRLLCFNEISDGERAHVKLPHSSFILHGTCNPDPDRDSVFPLTKEARFVSIDVPPLTLTEAMSFTREQLSNPNRGPGFKSELLDQAVLLIRISRKCVESSKPQIGTVSLRDAVRCAALTKRLGSQSWQGMPDSFFDVLEAPEEGWCIHQNQDRALALACYICYGMRVIPRTSFFLELQKHCHLQLEKFILQVKSCIVKHFSFPPFVVMTPALQDNILAAVVAISARLPLLCLGCDGTSKTLSINTLLSQMHGRFSKSKLLQRLAKAQAFNLQLSEQSTAGHIVKLKKTIVSWGSDLSIPVIFMEEMSMADMGPNGPLRALHDLLDSHQEGQNSRGVDENIGTGSNSFGFLATSNYGPGNTLPVGRALGNRLLILAHETLPVSSLVQLAASVGMQSVTEKDEKLRKDREAALTSMLSSLLDFSSGTEPLVPNIVSIRSLLFFSRALAMALSIPNMSVAEAQVRAFSAHLQRVTREQTESLWKHAGGALRWRLDAVKRPSVHDIVEDSFGPCRTRRPLLFLYQSPADIFKAVSITMKLFKKAYHAMEDKDTAVEFKKVCPTVQRLTHERVAHSRVIDGAESLFALIQLRSAVEKGGLITILNPEPIIEGIHALLNDSGAEHSTLQLRQSHENVRIHWATQIVLLVERSSALRMHRALMSRVAVVNSGVFFWSDTDSNEKTLPHYVGAHSSLMLFYSDHTVTNPTNIIEELRLLNLCESAFDDLIENLLIFGPSNQGTGAAETYGRLVVTLIAGRVPVMLANDQRILHLDIVKFNTPALFFGAVMKAVEQLEVNSAVRSPLLLIDLTAAEPVAAVECLVLMGFAGVRFSTVACEDSLSSRLMQLAARPDRRVVIALEVSRSASCLPAKYRAWAPVPDGPKPPKISDLVSIVEVREMSRSYQDWPSLSDLAADPALLWKRAVDCVAEQISSVMGGDELDPEESSLRKDIADLALRYCTPESHCAAVLCPSPKVDLSESPLSGEQLQNARMHLFRTTLKRLLAPDHRASFQSLRSGLIEACRTLSYRAAATLLQRLPQALIARPNKEILVFVRRILAARTFPWQNQDYSASYGAFQEHALYAHISSVQITVQKRSADVSFPFLRDLLNILKITLNGDIRVIDTPERLKNALEYGFPTLKGGLNMRSLGPLFSAALVEDLVCRYGPQLIGSHVETAKQWLTQASDGTLHGILHTFYKSEGLLAVASFLKRADGSSASGIGDGGKVRQGVCLESLAIAAVQECLDCAVRAKSWHAEMSPSFARAVQRALSGWERSAASGRRQNVNRIEQILLLWGLHAPSAAGAAAQDALRVACDVLDGRAVGVSKLVPGGLEVGRAIMIGSALDKVDEISQLPMDSVAAAVVALGPVHGRSLLASTALRREGGLRALEHVFDFLRTALRNARPDEAVGMREETAMAAAAVRKICVRFNVSALQAAEYTLRLQQSRRGPPCEALCLAVGAFVLSAEQFLEQVIGQQSDRRFRELASLFFDPKQAGSAAEPLQMFLVRCLVARLDENGLPRLADRLPQVVGDWISRFLVRVVEGPMAGLVAIPDFDRLLGDRDLDQAWPDALHQAVAGQLPGDPPLAWQRQVVAAAEDEALAFCRLVVVSWCFFLRLRAPTSVLSSDEFGSEGGLSGLVLPASREGPMEMMRRLRQQLGVTSVNRCPCGHIYGIGNCGQPMETRPCPDCRRPIGGTNHQWVGGQNQGVADDDDLVRGVALDWFCAGTGYVERELQPLEYRVLAVLLLIPLAVFSPRAAERRQQLRRHWDALREVGGLASDTDTQHFLLGLLSRCLSRGARTLPGLTMAGISLRGPGERAEAERVFAGAFRELLARAAPRIIVAEVQQSMEASEAGKPLVALREGAIAALGAGEAARRFAPAVLRLAHDVGSGGANDFLGELRKEVALYHERFPVLARCLFDEDSPDATPALVAAADLGAAKRLKHLPNLVNGFKLLHQRAATLVDGGSCGLDTAGSAEAALEAESGSEEGKRLAVQFRDAWNVCRYGQRVECQDVPDLGDLSVLGLGDMVLVAERAGADGLSRAETLLGGLTASHNAGVRVLLAGDGSGAEGGGSGEGTAMRLWDAASAELLQGLLHLLLVPWCKARKWVEAELIPALPPGCCRAEVVEPLVRTWLSQRQGSPPSLLTLDGWPRVAARAQSGAVRVTVVEQKASIPAAAREALDDWVRQHGLLRDRVTISLEYVQRVAARVERAGRATSPEVPIADLLREFLSTQQAARAHQQSATVQQCPSPLREMVNARSAQLRARHLNALQEELAARIDARAEDALGTAYRVELPPAAAAALIEAGAGTDGAAAAQARLAALQRRLIGLAEMLAQGDYSPAHSMTDYLAAIEDGGDASDYSSSGGEDEEGLLGRVAGLRLEHAYHALVQVRMASAALR